MASGDAANQDEASAPFPGETAVLAALIDAAADAITSLDRNGVIRSWNAGAERLLGYTAEEAIGRRPDFLIPDELTTAIPPLRQRVLAGERIEVDSTRRRKDGSLIDVHSIWFPLRDETGEIVGYGTAVRDARERTTIERTVHRMQERWHALLALMPVGVFETDATGSCLYVNERWSEITGLSAAEALGSGWTAAIHPDDRGKIQSAWAAAGRRRRDFQSELRYVRPSGEVVHALAQGRAYRDESGEIAGYVGAIIDLTDRRVEEERRLHAMKMASVAAMAAGIAHDFNNLLTTVLGNLELIEAVAEPGSPDHESATEALEAARQAATYGKELLNLAGAGSSRHERVEIAGTIRAVLATFKTRLKDVPLAFEPGPEPLFVRGDGTQLQRAFANLVLNAADAVAATGGSVSIVVQDLRSDELGTVRFPPDREAPDGYVRVDVDDTGPGMDADLLGRIFDPFFTTRPTGRGLGLAVVVGVVRGMGGGLDVVSTPGVGSSFRVYLRR